MYFPWPRDLIFCRSCENRAFGKASNSMLLDSTTSPNTKRTGIRKLKMITVDKCSVCKAIDQRWKVFKPLVKPQIDAINKCQNIR